MNASKRVFCYDDRTDVPDSCAQGDPVDKMTDGRKLRRRFRWDQLRMTQLYQESRSGESLQHESRYLQKWQYDPHRRFSESFLIFVDALFGK